MATYDLQQLMAAISNKRAELDAKSGRNNAIKPPAGRSRWRVLPGWRASEPLRISHEFAQHWIKDAAGNVDGRVYVCEKEVFGRECEICDMLGDIFRGLKAQGITKDSGHPLWKTVTEWNAKVVHLVNVLCTDGANKNLTKPLIMALPTTAFTAFLTLLGGRAAEGINLLDLQNGRDITIERKGTGFDTEYSVMDVAVSTAVDPDVMNNIINIDAFIEAEAAKGRKKGAPAAISTMKGVLSGTSTAPRSLLPSKAGLVPGIAAPAPVPAQNRVIEEGEQAPWEPPGDVIEAVAVTAPAAAVAPPATAQPITVAAQSAPAPAAPQPVAAPAAFNQEFNEQELQDLIAAL